MTINYFKSNYIVKINLKYCDNSKSL